MKCAVHTGEASEENLLVLNPTRDAWNTYICTYSVISRTLSGYIDGVLVGTYVVPTKSFDYFTASNSGTLATDLFPGSSLGIDIKSAYSFVTLKDASQASALNDLMKIDGTPCAFWLAWFGYVDQWT
jgi:hypothetical protein